MADKEQDPDDTSEDEAMLEQFDLKVDPQALGKFMAFAENMDAIQRIRIGALMLLASARHPDLKWLPDTNYMELMRRTLKAYAWAIRHECVLTLRQHVIDNETLDMDETAKDTSGHFSEAALELGQYISLVAMPTDNEKAKPQ